MPNPYGAPEITVQQVHQNIEDGRQFILLDVREHYELPRAALNDPRVTVAPLSRLAQVQLAGLPEGAQDKEAAIVIFCHHGVRSAQVTQWLRQQGWQNVVSMAGGIDAWANEIDPSVGKY